MSKTSSEARERLRVIVRGAVQGVGFRPFVHRLATRLHLDGWVENSAAGVWIEVEGSPAQLEEFLSGLESERPAIAVVQSLESWRLEPVGYADFMIRPSRGGQTLTLAMPDIALCAECRREIFDVANRRHLYAFTNCTNCGPRFTIIESLPYDRPATTMKNFVMCPACRREYSDPADRRFHAQPNACPECGPQLSFCDADGAELASRHAALRMAAERIRAGGIVAVKGIGGFHLMVDARNDEAVQRLRERKRREAKPFALMAPSLVSAHSLAAISAVEERALQGPAAPIVLLRRRASAQLAASVAPGNPWLGVMLPYTPMHWLLMSELEFPVVATSGNLSDEPICTDNAEALERLRGVADFFLMHDRPILRHVDDSIVRVVAGRELVLRRARGFAPLPITLERKLPSILAVGAHQKSAVALTQGAHVFLSQHLGDLETPQALAAFEQAVDDLEKQRGVAPELIACDLHPDYLSTQFARRQSAPVEAVQHHAAHAFACLSDNALALPALAFVWDGSGYGPDRTVWGGETLWLGAQGRTRRLAHLRRFALPGSEKAVKQPRRSALGALHESLGAAAFAQKHLRSAFSEAEWRAEQTILERRINAPLCSSVGRLFDVVAALAGVRSICDYEGQAAMELEHLAMQSNDDAAYPTALRLAATARDGWTLDWAPMLDAILRDVEVGVDAPTIARRFHHALSRWIVEVSARILDSDRRRETPILLTGGCFQNKLLTELSVERLRAAGLRPFWHQRVPPNDGGVALGQAVAASWAVARRRAAAKL